MPNNINNVLSQFIQGITKIIGKDLKKVILYGSYARNTQNQDGETSDIDIMILVDVPENNIRIIQKKVLDYSADIDLEYNVLISPLIESVNNYNDRVKYMLFYKNVEKEGKVLYA